MDELERRFGRIRAAVARETGLGLRFGVFLPAAILLWIALIFGVLFAIGVPVDFDDVTIVPGDPAYVPMMTDLVTTLAGVGLGLALVGFVFGRIPGRTTRWLTADENGDPAVYVQSPRREFLVCSAGVFAIDPRHPSVRASNDPDERHKLLAQGFFWIVPPRSDEERSLREGKDRLNVRTKGAKLVFSRRTTFLRIRLDAAGAPRSCTEAVQLRFGGSSTLERWVRYTYADLGRHVSIPIHPAIREAIRDRVQIS